MPTHKKKVDKKQKIVVKFNTSYLDAYGLRTLLSLDILVFVLETKLEW